jgi:hypothetical protein
MKFAKLLVISCWLLADHSPNLDRALQEVKNFPGSDYASQQPAANSQKLFSEVFHNLQALA